MMGPVVLVVSFMNVAGAQAASLRIAQGLHARGIETELWFLYREVAMPEAESWASCRVLLDCKRPSMLSYLRIACRLAILLRKTRPSAVISFLPLANVLGQTMALLSGVRVRIASARGPISTYGRVMRKLDWLLARWGGYTRIMAVSENVATGYASLPAHRKRLVSVVHNGVARSDCPITKREAREQLALPQGVLLAVTAGRFKPQKNYEFQIDIARFLTEGLIVTAGNGPLFPQMRARAQQVAPERMVFLGNLSRSAMAVLYRAADVFIQPSLYEGQSNALLEAMQAGLPILAADTPAQRETLIGPDEEAGMLLSLDAPEAWAKALEELARDPGLRAVWAARARLRSMDFSVDAQIDGVENLLSADPIPRTSLTISSADCA